MFDGVGSALSTPYSFKYLKGCLPEILLGPFLNTLTHFFLLKHFIREAHIAWCIGKSNSSVYVFVANFPIFPNNSGRIHLLKLKIDMLYNMENTFRLPVFKISVPESLKKVLLKIFQNLKENPCVGASIKKIKNKKKIIKKETPTQVLSCELCEIFKNSFFTEHLRVTASVKYK